MTAPKPHGECWCCGAPGPVQATGKGQGLCRKCTNRWSQKHWQGPGPGDEFMPRAERAREHAHTITTRSISQAADQLGISQRTVVRWRKALAVAS